MGEVLVRDVTRAGRELGRAVVTDLAAAVTIGALLERRIHDEVTAYNRAPGPVLVGLVQPADSIRHSDGFRMRTPRELDADAAVLAFRDAVATGMLSFRLGDETTSDLEHVVDVDGRAELLVVLERPVVADI